MLYVTFPLAYYFEIISNLQKCLKLIKEHILYQCFSVLQNLFHHFLSENEFPNNKNIGLYNHRKVIKFSKFDLDKNIFN